MNFHNLKLSSPYYQGGLAYAKKGNFRKALEYFEAFLNLEPDGPEASQVKTIIEEMKKRIKKN